MTTRANAYAYIRNIKKLSNFSGSRSIIRILSRDANPIAPLLRLRRDVHTTCRPSTAVTIRDNKAGVVNIIRSKNHNGRLSTRYPGTRGFSTPVQAKSVADASFFDEPAQKNETTSLGEESVVFPQDGVEPDKDAKLRSRLTRQDCRRAIFYLLITQKFSDRLEVSFKQRNCLTSQFECSISFSFNEAKAISATAVGELKVGFVQSDFLAYGFLTLLRTKAQGSNTSFQEALHGSSV